MKKLIVLVLILMLLFCMVLVGCGRSYKEAKEVDTDTLFGDYFTIAKEWGSPTQGWYYILYANDSKVMYYYYTIGNRSGMTPLYNADGSLQIYTEKSER